MTRANIIPGNFSDAAIERHNNATALHKRRVTLVKRDIAAQRRAALVVTVARYTLAGVLCGLAVAFFA
jgi:hypothetical protein